MMTTEEFAALALSFPEVVQGRHVETDDFRVEGKIFATLRQVDRRCVLKLSPDEQQLFMETAPGMFEPVPGSWGQKGWTRVVLEMADGATVRHAMTYAWRSITPKKMHAKLDG